MLKIALIGCGYIAQAEHIPNWMRTPGVELVAVVDQRIDMAREIGAAYGISAFGSIGEAWEAQEIDAVHICTSLDSHVPLVIECARAGKHVLVEKPLAETAVQGAEAVAAAESAGVVLMVGYQKLADTDVAYVGDLIQTGRLGSLLGVHSVFRISQPPLYRLLGSQPSLPFLAGEAEYPTDLHVRMLNQSAHHFNVFNTWLPGGLQVESTRGHGPLWAISALSAEGVPIQHLNAAGSGHGEEFWAYFEKGSVHVSIWSPHFPATHGSVDVFETAADRTYQPITARVNPYLAMLELFVEMIDRKVGWRPAALTAVEDLRTIAQVERIAYRTQARS